MFEKLTLPNGVRIVAEHVPNVRSAALGIWVGSGSRYESARDSGASHFIEHMVFKGTETRSAGELAALMDAVGGQTNAFTTKECTVFYGRVLDTHLDRLSDVLCDMFFRSKFDETDVINERGVVYEEIDMYRDTPDDLVSERLFASCFKGSGLARPILGSRASLAKMTGESLKAYMRSHYTAENVVVALSGSFTDADRDSLAARFAEIPSGKPRRFTPGGYTPSFIVKKKSIEQNHLCLGFPGITATDDSRFTMGLLNSILGGGMSSRLFQSVREKNGLCYSIYSFGTCHSDVGIFSIYTATGKESEQKALGLIMEELERFVQDGVTAEELDRAREQVKANVVMELESTASRMTRLGRSELFFGRLADTDELIARYDAVTAEDIRELAQRCIDRSKISLSAVGKVESADYYRELLK